MTDEIKKMDLSNEELRTYLFGPVGNRQTIRIENPETLHYRKEGTTHRVSRGKNVWVVPSPGYHGCYIIVVLRDIPPPAPIIKDAPK